jgi:hypothetical protein
VQFNFQLPFYTVTLCTLEFTPGQLGLLQGWTNLWAVLFCLARLRSESAAGLGSVRLGSVKWLAEVRQSVEF